MAETVREGEIKQCLFRLIMVFHALTALFACSS
jgi:hypothetical protein